MYLLHIETATDICSIAVSKEGALCSLCHAAEGYSHAATITLLIQEAMQKAGIGMQDLDGVSVSSGPGSYTALRIGTSTAKGICYALGIPLVVVNTLQALALATYATHKDMEALYFPMIDARRMEVYTAGFDAKGHTQVALSAKIIDTDSFKNEIVSTKDLVFSGNGAAKCKGVIMCPNVHFYDIHCSAAHQVPLAYEAFRQKDFADTAYYTPLYYKAPNITTPKVKI